MEDGGELTPEECKGFRKIFREHEATKQREAQEMARRLTEWFKVPNRPMPK